MYKTNFYVLLSFVKDIFTVHNAMINVVFHWIFFKYTSFKLHLNILKLSKHGQVNIKTIPSIYSKHMSILEQPKLWKDKRDVCEFPTCRSILPPHSEWQFCPNPLRPSNPNQIYSLVISLSFSLCLIKTVTGSSDKGGREPFIKVTSFCVRLKVDVLALSIIKRVNR